MQINEKLIKITSKTPINTLLELAQDIEFSGKGEVIKVEEANNQDGTKDIIYKVKPTEISVK